MPRSISVMRKYLPALSSEPSLLSSQRSVRGRRKPDGGAPAGVAGRRVEEEKAAVATEMGVLDVRKVVMGAEDDGRARANAAKVLVGAMVSWFLRMQLAKEEDRGGSCPGHWEISRPVIGCCCRVALVSCIEKSSNRHFLEH